MSALGEDEGGWGRGLDGVRARVGVGVSQSRGRDFSYVDEDGGGESSGMGGGTAAGRGGLRVAVLGINQPRRQVGLSGLDERDIKEGVGVDELGDAGEGAGYGS